MLTDKELIGYVPSKLQQSNDGKNIPIPKGLSSSEYKQAMDNLFPMGGNYQTRAIGIIPQILAYIDGQRDAQLSATQIPSLQGMFGFPAQQSMPTFQNVTPNLTNSLVTRGMNQIQTNQVLNPTTFKAKV